MTDVMRMSEFVAGLRALAKDIETLYNVPRLAIEDQLIEFRDAGIGMLGRNNGLVINYADHSPSDIIRMTIEHALQVGLNALADHLEEVEVETVPQALKEGEYYQIQATCRSIGCTDHVEGQWRKSVTLGSTLTEDEAKAALVRHAESFWKSKPYRLVVMPPILSQVDCRVVAEIKEDE